MKKTYWIAKKILSMKFVEFQLQIYPKKKIIIMNRNILKIKIIINRLNFNQILMI